jgi:co-chaperonin GroES (HSP10)
MNTLIPLGARVVIETIEAPDTNTTPSGIILPDKPKASPITGKVVTVGRDVKYDIQVGDIIWFNPNCAYKMDPKDTTAPSLVDEGNIIAVISRMETLVVKELPELPKSFIDESVYERANEQITKAFGVPPEKLA